MDADGRSLCAPFFLLPLPLMFFGFFNLYSEKSKLVSDCLFNMGFASLVH